MEFRKKPVVVEAYQITRQLLEEVLFEDKPYPNGLRLGYASTHPGRREINSWVGYITTIHGQETRVIENDWIISEPDGEHFYPCKPDIFEATYEPVA